MDEHITKQADSDPPSNYVTTARIREIRKKMLHGSVRGSPEQVSIAEEIWHEDLPDLLETLERTQRGDFKESPVTLGCFGAVILAVLGALSGGTAFMAAESEATSLLEQAKQEAAQRCAELGGAYAEGGAKVGDRTVYCIGLRSTPARENSGHE